MSNLAITPGYEYNAYKTNLVFPDSNNIYKRVEPINKQAFEVVWKELTYRVRRRVFSYKYIINNVSGYFKSGQILAILGPSGCGKSSLLNCLSGTKKKGVIGTITISTKRKMKFAFVAQDDYLSKRLTVRESLKYASKLKNFDTIDHELNVKTIMTRLDLDKCADLRNNKCSGGQRKRVSIALELVSRPNILILDEPTSGLDTVTSWQLITTLIDLTQQSQPMAIVATIHQPSGKLFNLFNSAYIMSYDGHCIYQGPPQTLVNYLSQYGLKCPNFHNPSDFAVEVASKEHGIGKVMLLSQIMKIEALDLMTYDDPIQPFHQHKTCTDVWTLFRRTLKISLRDIWLCQMRLLAHIVFGVMLILFWGEDSGKLSGCPDNFIGEGNYVKNLDKVTDKLNENFGLICFILLMCWFGSIFAVLLTFPQEMNIFLKEYRNGWYSVYSYYMGHVLVDLVFTLLLPNLISIPAFLGTGQYFEEGEEWRLYYFIVICLLMALTSTSMGLMFSAWLMKWPTAAAFIGVSMGFPLFMFSGFMIPVKDMSDGFYWFSYIDFLRHALQAATATIYGWDRCENDQINRHLNITHWSSLVSKRKMRRILTTKKFNGPIVVGVLNFFSGQMSNDTESVLMRNMEFEDNDIYVGIALLFATMIIFKVYGYFLLLKKVKAIK